MNTQSYEASKNKGLREKCAVAIAFTLAVISWILFSLTEPTFLQFTFVLMISTGTLLYSLALIMEADNTQINKSEDRK